MIHDSRIILINTIMVPIYSLCTQYQLISTYCGYLFVTIMVNYVPGFKKQFFFPYGAAAQREPWPPHS